MSIVKENWEYFWSLVMAYPKATLATGIIYTVAAFVMGLVYEGLSTVHSLMLAVGSLIMAVPIKAFFTGFIRDYLRPLRAVPLDFIGIFFWRMILFGLIAGLFIWPVLAEYGSELPEVQTVLDQKDE